MIFVIWFIGIKFTMPDASVYVMPLRFAIALIRVSSALYPVCPLASWPESKAVKDDGMGIVTVCVDMTLGDAEVKVKKVTEICVALMVAPICRTAFDNRAARPSEISVANKSPSARSGQADCRLSRQHGAALLSRANQSREF
jgi:hypothetical protein